VWADYQANFGGPSAKLHQLVNIHPLLSLLGVGSVDGLSW
jgi:hypothetical protein